jgi:single-strand DNA-binding protein
LSKGDRIYVEGRIKTRKWTDDKGVERYSTEIQCTDFTFLTTKKDSQDVSNQPSQASNTTSSSNEQPDDLPF